MKEQCSENCKGLDLNVLIDSSTFNLNSKNNRLKDNEGLGLVFKDRRAKSFGFLLHPCLVYSHLPRKVIGISDVSFITRDPQRKYSKGREWESRSEPIENKETNCWLRACQSSKSCLKESQKVTFIMDRGGDITEIYDRVKDERHDVLARSNHNRKILTEEGKKAKLYEYINQSEPIGEITLVLNDGKRVNRSVKLTVRRVKCIFLWSKLRRVDYKKNVGGVPVTVIQVKEESQIGGEEPICWTLVSTKELIDLEQVKDEVKRYESRWLIEEYFKLLKTDGYDLENCQLESGYSIRKLTLFVMKTSIKVLRLKAARDGKGDDKVEDVFNAQEIECLEELNEQMEGSTEKQQNPYPKQKLAWATWIIARLAGWKEFYNVKRPPGNKTIIEGLDKFDGIMIGYNIFRKKDVS